MKLYVNDREVEVEGPMNMEEILQEMHDEDNRKGSHYVRIPLPVLKRMIGPEKVRHALFGNDDCRTFQSLWEGCKDFRVEVDSKGRWSVMINHGDMICFVFCLDCECGSDSFWTFEFSTLEEVLRK